MSDMDIARRSKKKDIVDIAKKLGINQKDVILYGRDKAKILINHGSKKGKLILVTAINPTPYGEGKTTVSIGLGDAFHHLGKDVLVSLRQPSMGPVFGMKGGATGGGYSQVVPMEDINLHFTGDFHSITSANNLLCAAIDNHIERGNKLDIQEVLFHRALDVNDRELRCIELKNRKEEFTITAASEIMAIFCLSTSLSDLRKRLEDIVIGKNKKGDYIYAKDLNVVGSLVVLLKDAFYPNLVQTLENTPTFIHGGPFANIAHGCSSIKSTKLALSLADYVVTEAGFGADLGAEKFFDIKCRYGNIKPDCIVLVATVRALKYHGKGILEDGIENLGAHIENIRKNNSNIIVCINRFAEDTEEEIKYIIDYCKQKEVEVAISTAYKNGGGGAIDLASKVLQLLTKDNQFRYLYQLNQKITDKIEILAKEIYHASAIEYSDLSLKKIQELEEKNMSNLPICVAKTQYSFSDDKEKIGNPIDYTLHIQDVRLYHGAGFITVYLGNILTMPGLPKVPNYEKIDLNERNEIIGIF